MAPVREERSWGAGQSSFLPSSCCPPLPVPINKVTLSAAHPPPPSKGTHSFFPLRPTPPHEVAPLNDDPNTLATLAERLPPPRVASQNRRDAGHRLRLGKCHRPGDPGPSKLDREECASSSAVVSVRVFVRQSPDAFSFRRCRFSRFEAGLELLVFAFAISLVE